MKRFLACLVFLTIAVIAMAGHYAQGEGMQETLNICTPVTGTAYEISPAFGHAIAYAENGVYSAQTLTAPTHSPRSGFHTASTGGKVPSLSPCGYKYELRHTKVWSVCSSSVSKLYVLRV